MVGWLFFYAVYLYPIIYSFFDIVLDISVFWWSTEFVGFGCEWSIRFPSTFFCSLREISLWFRILQMGIHNLISCECFHGWSPFRLLFTCPWLPRGYWRSWRTWRRIRPCPAVQVNFTLLNFIRLIVLWLFYITFLLLGCIVLISFSFCDFSHYKNLINWCIWTFHK